MTTQTPLKSLVSPEFLASLALLTQTRTDCAAAALVGVPVHTLRKWSNGTRAPSAAAVRLVEVLATLSALAPDLLAVLTPGVPVSSPAPLVTDEELDALAE